MLSWEAIKFGILLAIIAALIRWWIRAEVKDEVNRHRHD